MFRTHSPRVLTPSYPFPRHFVCTWFQFGHCAGGGGDSPPSTSWHKRYKTLQTNFSRLRKCDINDRWACLDYNISALISARSAGECWLWNLRRINGSQNSAPGGGVWERPGLVALLVSLNISFSPPFWMMVWWWSWSRLKENSTPLLPPLGHRPVASSSWRNTEELPPTQKPSGSQKNCRSKTKFAVGVSYLGKIVAKVSYLRPRPQFQSQTPKSGIETPTRGFRQEGWLVGPPIFGRWWRIFGRFQMADLEHHGEACFFVFVLFFCF